MIPIGPSFHLLLEPIEAPAVPDALHATPPWLEIPEGPTLLESTDAGPSLQPIRVPGTTTPDGRESDDRAGSPSSATPSAPFIVQPVREGPCPLLLFLVPATRRLFVNGRPAPPLTLLEEGDEVILDEASGSVAHVALYHHASVGPPRPEEVGMTCPLCLVPIDPDTTLYRCFHCGKPLHLEPDTRPEGDRLQCARLGPACPSCREPIRIETGYGRLPGFFREANRPPELSRAGGSSPGPFPGASPRPAIRPGETG